MDLTVKQIKSIVPKAKGSKKKDVQRSAMEVATYAQAKKLHKRLVICLLITLYHINERSYGST